ncbi:hypothetical protein ADL21_37440 [Streptomyces albus subsp. albus]|nr:hypothetical protein ADL21_37440 [Streptomyces albus subsp. albus]
MDWYRLARIGHAAPVEESVGALADLADLVGQGKVGRIGLYEVSAAPSAVPTTHPIGAVQTEYSPWEGHAEIDILPMICSLGATLIVYSPLGRGLLTGAARATTHSPPPEGSPRPGRIRLAPHPRQRCHSLPGSSRRPQPARQPGPLDLHLTATAAPGVG